jgi:hypothetical protein
MKISNGNNGTFNLSFGTEFKSGFEIEVVTSKGAVVVRPTEVVVTTKDEKGEKKEDVKKFEYSAGVKPEILAFAKALEAGKGKWKIISRGSLNGFEDSPNLIGKWGEGRESYESGIIESVYWISN